MSKFIVSVEHAGGEQFSLAAWTRNILKHQDREAWRRENPEEFKRNVAFWVKGQLALVIENLDVVVSER